MSVSKLGFLSHRRSTMFRRKLPFVAPFSGKLSSAIIRAATRDDLCPFRHDLAKSNGFRLAIGSDRSSQSSWQPMKYPTNSSQSLVSHGFRARQSGATEREATEREATKCIRLTRHTSFPTSLCPWEYIWS